MAIPRVLLLLSQLPQDPASGAARSMRTICEFLAASGMEVRALATTATECPGEFDAREFLCSIVPHVKGISPRAAGDRGDDVLQFAAKGVGYTLLHTGRHAAQGWEDAHGAGFDALFAQCLRDFRPDIVFTFGGTPRERARLRWAHEAGCKVVFGLRNWGYLATDAFQNVDAILTGSDFVSRRYREALGIDSTALPLPLDAQDVVATEHQRIFITYINPSIEKGVFFAARLFEELALRRPDIPILTIESRGTSGLLVSAGLTTEGTTPGFDLRRHESLMVGKPVARPAEIFALARVIVMPSVWEEPAGRVAAEALVNGIPPLVSDRGGLPEICGDGGFVLPIPPAVLARPAAPVPTSAVEPWFELLIRLVDDDVFYADACRRALAAGQAYLSQTLIPRYADFFRAVLKAPSALRKHS